MKDIKMKEKGKFMDHARDPIIEHGKGEVVSVSDSCAHQLVDANKAEYHKPAKPKTKKETKPVAAKVETKPAHK